MDNISKAIISKLLKDVDKLTHIVNYQSSILKSLQTRIDVLERECKQHFDDDEELYTTAEIADEYGMSEDEFNELLSELNIIKPKYDDNE